MELVYGLKELMSCVFIEGKSNMGELFVVYFYFPFGESMFLII